MGVQLHAEIDDLQAVGATCKVVPRIETDYTKDDQPYNVDLSYLEVTLPSGNVVDSYTTDSLTIDCKSINHDVRDELQELGVPVIMS